MTITEKTNAEVVPASPERGRIRGRMTLERICSECHGAGAVPDRSEPWGVRSCPVCGGHGKFRLVVLDREEAEVVNA